MEIAKLALVENLEPLQQEMQRAQLRGLDHQIRSGVKVRCTAQPPSTYFVTPGAHRSPVPTHAIDPRLQPLLPTFQLSVWRRVPMDWWGLLLKHRTWRTR